MRARSKLSLTTLQSDSTLSFKFHRHRMNMYSVVGSFSEQQDFEFVDKGTKPTKLKNKTFPCPLSPQEVVQWILRNSVS